MNTNYLDTMPITEFLSEPNVELTHETLISMYLLTNQQLDQLYNHIVAFLKERAINVTYMDLDPVIEVDVYKIDRQIEEEDKHHESCISDGAEVFLHYDMEDIGGICGRLYDIIHVGCGHIWQWGATQDSGLEFYGDKAWEVGSTFYLNRPEEDIQIVYRYEKEAAMLAMRNLKMIMEQQSYGTLLAKKIIDLFTDYMNCDLEYITSFYRTGAVENFFEGWKCGSNPLPETEINFIPIVYRRTNKCIALINLRK